jgi:hypothetical protein
VKARRCGKQYQLGLRQVHKLAFGAMNHGESALNRRFRAALGSCVSAVIGAGGGPGLLDCEGAFYLQPSPADAKSANRLRETITRAGHTHGRHHLRVQHPARVGAQADSALVRVGAPARLVIASTTTTRQRDAEREQAVTALCEVAVSW